MKKPLYRQGIPKGLCLFFIITSFAVELFAQTLPEQLYFSEDGTRLMQGGIESQGFYDETVVRNIYLEFYDTDYWQQMMENFGSDEFVLARLIYEQEVFDSVAVQFKGQTSFNKAVRDSSEKLSFDVKLDEVIEGQDIEGYNTFNFNNAFQDPSFMKEVLYARLSRELLPSLKGNFIRLFLNGEDWGLYPNIQQLNGDFIREWFPDNDGIRWRADAHARSEPEEPQTNSVQEPPGGGGGQWGDGTAALNYLGEEVSEYQKYYTLKDADLDDPWNFLIRVCDLLNNPPLDSLQDTLAPYLDLDGTLWFLAREILFSDDDSYVHKGKMDYYLFVDEETGRMVPLEFDGNSAMSLRNVGWSPFLNEDNPNYPLLNRLLAVPHLRQRYIAHMKTLLDRSLDPVKAKGIINGYATLIDPHVQNDPKIDFTYTRHNRFVNDLRNFVDERRSNIMSHAEFSVESPVFGTVQRWVDGNEGESPMSGQEVVVTASATHSGGIGGLKLYFGQGLSGNFISLPMTDDGTGPDEIAGDGIYAATISPHAAGTYVRYYVEAVAGNAEGTVSFMPEGAEYEVFVYRAGVDTSDGGGLVINEFLASNDRNQADEFGEYNDWVEIHNRSGEAISLGGYHLTDDGSDLTKWPFPEFFLDPWGYMVVWADGDPEQGDFHCNFKISAGGEELFLSDSGGVVVDFVSFDTQETDISFGRWPDGSGPFCAMVPTFGEPNHLEHTGTPTMDTESLLTVYPNPAIDLVRIRYGGLLPELLFIFNIQGRILYEGPFKQSMDVSGWPEGIYLVRVGPHSRLLQVY